MLEYKFETSEFGLSSEGVHLLRSRFNYKTYPFKEVDTIAIEKGKLVDNWILLMAIGGAMIFFAIYYTVMLIKVFNDPHIHSIDVYEIVVPVLPLMAGVYCMYAALKTGPVLKVYSKGKYRSLPLTSLRKEDQLQDMINFLQTPQVARGKVKVNLERK